MTCHYKPYSCHYAIKKFIHKNKFGGSNFNLKSDKSVLLIVNVQNDYLPGGAMEIMGHKSDKGVYEFGNMINSINELISSDVFDYYLYVQDVHTMDNVSLASSHKDADPFEIMNISSENGSYLQVLWPDHCIINSENNYDKSNYNGYKLSDKLVLPFVQTDEVVSQVYNLNKYMENPIMECAKINQKPEVLTEKMKRLNKKSYIMWTGHNKNIDSFSAFKNSDKSETGLTRFLLNKGIKNVYVCGLTRNQCAWWTAVDATTYENNETQNKEFNVNFILDATLPSLTSDRLPDFDPNGHSLHQIAIKKIGTESVLADLEKNNVVNNMWANAFLHPYGVKTVSWTDTINDIRSDTLKQIRRIEDVIQKDKQPNKSIFVNSQHKIKVVKNNTQMEQPDQDFLNFISKVK